MSKRNLDIYDAICIGSILFIAIWGYVVFHFIVKWW